MPSFRTSKGGNVSSFGHKATPATGAAEQAAYTILDRRAALRAPIEAHTAKGQTQQCWAGQGKREERLRSDGTPYRRVFEPSPYCAPKEEP